MTEVERELRMLYRELKQDMSKLQQKVDEALDQNWVFTDNACKFLGLTRPELAYYRKKWDVGKHYKFYANGQYSYNLPACERYLREEYK